MGATGNGHAHEKPLMITSHEYDALRRDIKAVRDQQVSDLETLSHKIHGNREHHNKANERLAGQVLALHKTGNALVAEVGLKVDALAEAVLAHIVADAEWKERCGVMLVREHDRTSELEKSVDSPIPRSQVLGLSSEAWKRLGQVIAATVASVAITSCALRSGLIAPIPDAAPVRQNFEGP